MPTPWIVRLLTVQVGYLDREQTFSYLPLYFHETNDPRMLLQAFMADGRLQAVSSATIAHIMVHWSAVANSAPETVTGSIMERACMVFRTDSGEYGNVEIPAPRADLFDQFGCFAGLRINPLHPDIVVFIDAILNNPAVCTASGEMFTSFVSGGLRRVWSQPERYSG